MAYSDDIVALSPDHRWKFDGDSIDDIGALTSTDTSMLFTGSPLCEDTTNSAYTNADGDSVLSTASTDTSYAVNDVLYAGWFMTNAIQQPPCRIIGDGGVTQSMAIYLGFGNNLIFEIDYATTVLQVYSDNPLEVNRVYHLAVGYTSSNELVAYVDGIQQTNSAGTTGSAMANSRGAIRFGGTTLTTSFTIGGTGFKVVSSKNGYYNQWATYNVGIPSATQIREELFEKGALPEVTITDQTGLDALAGTLYPDSPLSIRVDIAGDATLDADNITFDDKVSIHVQYTGTGTLTWNNINGSNASIFSTPNGGTVETPTNITITINAVDANTLLPIENARVYIKEDGGSDIVNDLTDVGGVVTTNYTHTVDKSIVGVVRKGSSTPLYKPSAISSKVVANNLTLNILMVGDE